MPFETHMDADMALALELQLRDEEKRKSYFSDDVVITKVSIKFCQDLEDTAVTGGAHSYDADALLAQFLQSDEDATRARRRTILNLDAGLATALLMEEEEKCAVTELSRMQAEDIRFDAVQITS